MAQLDDDRPWPLRRGCGEVKTVMCSCGYIASGETAEELLADVEAHIDAVHSSEPATPASTPGSAPIAIQEAKQ